MTNHVAEQIRRAMGRPAKIIDRLSNGRITPNHITTLSLVGHIAVFFALYPLSEDSYPRLAALLLVLFGLLDSLDGALARIQKSATTFGMFYDAVSDRAKELLVYTGLGFLVFHHPAYLATDSIIIIAICGGALLISYIKAKGEMAIAGNKNIKKTSLNRLFSGGLAPYEIRMLLAVIGLYFGILDITLRVLMVLILITIVTRFFVVSRHIKNV